MASKVAELIKIDADACSRCGLCVMECPASTLHQPAELDGLPAVAPDRGCIGCFHCMCVCPTGALVHGAAQPDQIVDVLPESARATREQAVALVRERRSVRSYDPVPPPRPLVEALLAAANSAPTASNQRRIRYVVLSDPAILDSVRAHALTMTEAIVADTSSPASKKFADVAARVKAGADVFLRGAPLLLCAHMPGKARMNDIDLASALETVEILAPAFGLATCWAGYIISTAENVPALREMLVPLGIPLEDCVQFLMLGTPKVSYPRVLVPKLQEAQWH